MVTVKVLRPPINSDPAAEVPRTQWKELLNARREFCEQELPHDCRLLLFFIQDAAANDWLGLESRERYIKEGLKLQPQMVEWALEGLKATRPDIAVKFADAVEAGLRANGQRGKQVDKSSGNARPLLGKQNNADYIRARLERDAEHHEDPVKREQAARLLPRVQSGEISAHAAAVEAGWRTRMVQIAPTVEGFARAARKHLDSDQLAQLKEQLS